MVDILSLGITKTKWGEKLIFLKLISKAVISILLTHQQTQVGPLKT